MERVNIENLKSKIAEYEQTILILEDKKNNLISENTSQINEVIRRKVEELSDQLKSEAIEEVVGEKRDSINTEINNYKNIHEILSSLIEKDNSEELEQVEKNNEETSKEVEEENKGE